MSRMYRLLCAAVCAAGLGVGAGPITLPKPQTEGGKPLMEVLKARRSAREFSPEKLSPQVLSNLLWAAFGINRADGRRTAPSASNRQEIEIYAAMAEGLYRYDAAAHRLEPVLEQDVRAATGTQHFVSSAPLNLVYVADMSRVSPASRSAEDTALYTGADTGCIAQNVYLFCASEGLATVVRAGVDRASLARLMKLPENRRITLAQSVGYPAK